MKAKIKILIPIILCLTLSFSVCAQSFDDLEPINDRENSVSVFEDVESETEIPQSSSKTTKDDVLNTILFTLGLKVPTQAEIDHDDGGIFDAFIGWLGSRNLSAANQLDNLTNNYLTTQPYGIGQVFNITRELWETLREETSDGVTLNIQTSSVSMPWEEFYRLYVDNNAIANNSSNQSAYITPWTFIILHQGNVQDGYGNVYCNTFGEIVTVQNTKCLMVYDQNVVGYYAWISNMSGVTPSSRNFLRNIVYQNNFIIDNGIKYIPVEAPGFNSSSIEQSGSSSSNLRYDKFDGRAELSNDSDYNVISKSDNLDAPIWNSSGDAPSHTHLQSSDIQMNIVKSDKLANISEKIDNEESDLTDEMVQTVGVAPYDESTGYALNGLELAAIGAAMMNVVAQDLGQSIFEEAWNTVETFSFSLPSQSFVNVALWLSHQMETILYLTDFNQVFTMTCILLVACSLVGLTRLWKSAPNDIPNRTYKKPSRSNRKEK